MATTALGGSLGELKRLGEGDDRFLREVEKLGNEDDYL